MKNFINRFWWLFPLLFIVSLFTNRFTYPLLIVSTITLMASWILLLIYSKWKKCLASFAISAVASLAFFGILLYAINAMFNPGPDDFGKEHTIPASLAYNIPLEEGSELTTPIDSTATDTWLQIWNDFQGGMYTYDFYYPALEEGVVFLRCYEATENIPLSSERISEASKVAVPSTTSFSKVVEKQCFTIYPGDWGDYYAARIEVWHKDANTGKERKLMEKVYRVEGWQR